LLLTTVAADHDIDYGLALGPAALGVVDPAAVGPKLGRRGLPAGLVELRLLFASIVLDGSIAPAGLILERIEVAGGLGVGAPGADQVASQAPAVGAARPTEVRLLAEADRAASLEGGGVGTLGRGAPVVIRMRIPVAVDVARRSPRNRHFGEFRPREVFRA